MLKYGETFLEANKEALKRLENIMTPEAFKVAVEMAPQQDEDDEFELNVDEEQPVAA